MGYEKRKSVGVITFHNYDNYGAILQSYALQRRLIENGTDSEIVDYNCKYINNPFSINTLKKKGAFNYVYGAIGHICYIPRRYLCNKFRELINYSEEMTDENRKEIGRKYDAYIAGSDQIWDYKLTDFDHTYFLDFVDESKKKFSYAASLGEALPPEEYQAEYTRMLSSFDHIIVREDYGADLVEKMIGKRPDVACDPTLLLTAEEWKEVASRKRQKDKYILVYQLGINPELVDFVKRLKDKTGLKVIYIPFPLVGVMKCKLELTIGPKEWLALFRDAEYVVSDSFHGIVFSLIFNHDFFAMTNGHHRNKRVEQLLKKVRLENRTIEDVPDEQLTESIDFTFANQAIAEYREESLEKLKGLIEEI